jgi:hypothetical protein
MSDNNSGSVTVEVNRNYKNYDCGRFGCDADLIHIRVLEEDADHAPVEVVRICDDPDCDLEYRKIIDEHELVAEVEIYGVYDDSGDYDESLCRPPRFPK